MGRLPWSRGRYGPHVRRTVAMPYAGGGGTSGGGGTLNLVTNGGFEIDTTGWSATGTGSFVRITTDSQFGVASLQVTNLAQNDGALFQTTGNAGQNSQFTASVYLKAKAAGDIGKNAQLLVQSVAGGFELFGVGYVLTGSWARVSETFAWANTGHTGWILTVRATDLAPGSFLLDGVQYEIGASATPYVNTP